MRMQHERALAALAGERLVVVDVEGNGQQPPEIVELAMVAIQDGVLAAPRTWLVRPQRPITPMVTRKVHGIRNADVADAPSFAAIREDVQALLGDAWFVAHNARVEQDILTPQLPGWKPRGVLDTLRLTRAVWPGRAGYGLDALIEQERLDLAAVAAVSQRHRAAYDAYATALLLLCLLDGLGDVEHPLARLAELAAATRRAHGAPPAQQESLWTSPAGQPRP
jgi:DNA polymerase III epsilon subunit-like protein